MAASPTKQIETSTLEGLREYHYLVSEMLWKTYCGFLEHLHSRLREILDTYNERSEKGKQAAGFELHEVEVQYTMMLNYAMLPRFLGVFEREVKAICKIADPVAYSSIRQNAWLKNHRQFLKDQGVDLKSVDHRFDAVQNLVILRDCIIHANGEVAACKHPKQVLLAITQVETAELFKDGFLWVGDQVIPNAQITISTILRHLFEHFGYPLSWAKWH
jgi:hypothetical protein